MAHLPSLTSLRCFDASARHGSFTRAGAELHLTQGAVSHQVIGLEQQLGLPLFIRRRHGLELTEAGQAYWPDVNSALRQLERATDHLLLSRGKGGTLSLSVASTFGSFWLMARLPSFVAAYPQVTLNLSTRIGPVNFQAPGAPDASIEYSTGPADGILATQVMPLTLWPHAPAAAMRPAAGRLDRKQLAALLRKLPLIRHTTVPQAWPGWLSAAGLAKTIPQSHLDAGPQYDLLSMALNAVIAGLGIALLPDYLAREAVAQRRIRRISETCWTSTKAYYLRYPQWKADLPALKSFAQWLDATT